MKKEMKLIYCKKCGDMFKLGRKMKTCDCGAIKGRYINDIEAEVSEEAVSVAIGNGSFFMSVVGMEAYQKKTNDTATRKDYIENAPIPYTWVRPNTGPGNPHCSVIIKE